MRRSILLFAASVIAASSLTGCAVEEISSPDSPMAPRPLKVNFTTRTASTKTAFGAYDEATDTYPVSWTAADLKIGMSLNYASPVEATVLKDESVSDYADFLATFEDCGTPYQFFGFSPLSAAKAVSESRICWVVTIPTVQTPRVDGLSCDESAMLLYAQSEKMKSLPDTPIQLTFGHVTSYCRLILKNLESAFDAFEISGAEVLSVDVTYSVPVAGDWYVAASDGAITPKEASHTITILPKITDYSKPAELWFALAPCVLDRQKVKVSVNTDEGTITREFTYGTRTYAAGSVNKLTLDMMKGTEFVERESVVFELVKSASDIALGDQLIILDSKDPSYGMTATTNSSNGFRSVAKGGETGFLYNAANATVSLPETSSVAVWEVATKSGSEITLKTDGKYLASNATTNVHYAYFGTAKSFTLAVDSGVSQLYYKSKSGKTTYSLWYNTSGYFNYFVSANNLTPNKDLALFRRVVTINNPEEDPILEKTECGAYLSSGNTVYVPGVSQLSREYEELSTTFAVLFPADNSVLQFSGIPSGAAKGDEFKLVVVRVVGAKKTVVGTFDVTVVKEDGAKLWLSDFGGNGFIVKR